MLSKIEFLPLIERRRIKGVKLRLRNTEPFNPENTPPIKKLQEGGEPIGGKVNIKLQVLYPGNLAYDDLREVVNAICDKFSSLNLGEVQVEREDIDMYETNLNALHSKLSEKVSEIDPAKYLPFVVIPDKKADEFYVTVKRVCTLNDFHSQVAATDTLEESKVEEVIGNICLGIYVEYLLQRARHDKKFFRDLKGLTWILDSSADGENRTVYMGFDHSVRRLRGGERAGAAFSVVFDGQGRLLGGSQVSTPSDRIDEYSLSEVLRDIKRIINVRKVKADRICLFRDGRLRASEVKLFIKCAKEHGFSEVVCVGVVKRHIRKFVLWSEEKTANPRSGDWAYLGSISFASKKLHKVVLCTTSPAVRQLYKGRVKRTVVPVFLEILADDYEKVLREYYWLCHLNFWCWHGSHKLCLPVRVADALAKLVSRDIMPKFPSL